MLMCGAAQPRVYKKLPKNIKQYQWSPLSPCLKSIKFQDDGDDGDDYGASDDEQDSSDSCMSGVFEGDYDDQCLPTTATGTTLRQAQCTLCLVPDTALAPTSRTTAYHCDCRLALPGECLQSVEADNLMRVLTVNGYGLADVRRHLLPLLENRRCYENKE